MGRGTEIVDYINRKNPPTKDNSAYSRIDIEDNELKQFRKEYRRKHGKKSIQGRASYGNDGLC